MLLIINKRATQEEIKKMAEDFDGYIKVVVDLELKILAGGGKRHVEGEQKLLNDGSKQQNLWGGGVDFANKRNRLQFNNKSSSKRGQSVKRHNVF